MNQLLPRLLIFLTFFGNCLIIGLLLSALVTSSWITANISYISTNGDRSKYGFVNFGLFNYEKTLNHGYGERNEKDINVISVIKDDDEVLGNYNLWLGTALGTGLSLFASSVAAVLSVIGTIREKTSMLLIITSNVVSGLAQILSFTCWILQFVHHLRDNVLLKVDQEKWTSKDQARFGYSFFFVLIAFLLVFINLILLTTARRVENRHRKNLEDPIEEKEGNSIMLY
jgi:clarin